MSGTDGHAESRQRRRAMLRTAMGPAIGPGHGPYMCYHVSYMI